MRGQNPFGTIWICLNLVACIAVSPSNPIPFQVIAEGHRASDFQSREGRVISNAAEWDSLKQSLMNDFVFQPPPEVDFTQQIVIVVFGGEKPSSGYAIKIDSVSEVSNRLVVRVREVKLHKDNIALAVITYPFQIVTLSNSSGAMPIDFVFD
jgi:hypothetical protein